MKIIGKEKKVLKSALLPRKKKIIKKLYGLKFRYQLNPLRDQIKWD